MDETLLKLKILTKAESTLIKANARRMALRARLFAMAIGLLLLMVVMLNVAAFEFFSEVMSEGAAGLTIAGINGFLALVVILVALRIQPGPEEAMVHDIREMALTELSADLDAVKGEFGRIRDDVNSIKSGLSRAKAMISPNAPGGSLVPALGLITSMLRK